MTEIVSRPYHPQMACERCVFGSGRHANFCPKGAAYVQKEFREVLTDSMEEQERLYQSARDAYLGHPEPRIMVNVRSPIQ